MDLVICALCLATLAWLCPDLAFCIVQMIPVSRRYQWRIFRELAPSGREKRCWSVVCHAYCGGAMNILCKGTCSPDVQRHPGVSHVAGQSALWDVTPRLARGC